jgi:Ca2+/Na+ antiporter
MGIDGSLFGPVSRTQVLQMALAEVVGTGMLIFLGCMGTVVGMVPDGGHPHLLVAFAFGLTVMICIQVGVLTYERLINQCTKECQ